jgi:hypothetical protein
MEMKFVSAILKVSGLSSFMMNSFLKLDCGVIQRDELHKVPLTTDSPYGIIYGYLLTKE